MFPGCHSGGILRALQEVALFIWYKVDHCGDLVVCLSTCAVCIARLSILERCKGELEQCMCIVYNRHFWTRS